MSNINRIFIPKKGQSLKNGSVPSLGFTLTISIADWIWLDMIGCDWVWLDMIDYDWKILLSGKTLRWETIGLPDIRCCNRIIHVQEDVQELSLEDMRLLESAPSFHFSFPCSTHPSSMSRPPSFFPFFPSYPCPRSYLSVVCLTINKTDM